MKAILEFNLPEESEEHKLAVQGASYKYALDNMDNYFRNRLKYEELTEEVRSALQNARDALYQFTIDIS